MGKLSPMLIYSPLRYPGGKRRLTHTVMRILEENNLKDIHYAEPFAGGAAIALGLLYEEYASTVHLNDLSRPIYAFWHTAIHETDWLCKRIENVRVSMRVWKMQRAVFDRRDDADLAELGFATLFMNRCNRSGIIDGGVIGGNAQTGKWGIDARFGKPNLIERIRRIGRFRGRFHIYQMDAIDFTKKVLSKLGKQSFAFIDPPYIENGFRLYLNTYDLADHKRLANQVMKLRTPWAVTYDRSAIPHKLYEGTRRIVYDLNYAASNRYAGREVMFLSNELSLPPLQTMLGKTMYPVPSQCRIKIA